MSQSTGALLKIRLTPRSSRNEIVGWEGDTLRARVTAPPVEGAANKALVELIADALGIRRTHVCIVSGDKGREKAVRIAGLTLDKIRQAIP